MTMLPALPTGIAEGDPNHLDHHDALHGDLYNNWRHPTLNRMWLPSDFEPIGVWTPYVPDLIASTTNPNLGSGGTQYGMWKRNGDSVVVRFGIRFGTGGSSGAGLFGVTLPFPAVIPSNGMTSEMVGIGGLWRADSGLDLTGAHPEVWLYIDPTSDGSHVNLVGNAIHVPRESFTHVVTANQSAIANTGADLVNLTLAVRQKQATTRWKLRGVARFGLDTVPTTSIAVTGGGGGTVAVPIPRSVYLNVQEGSTILGAASTSLGSVGGFTNTATVIAETPIFVPTVGDHAYKLNAFADSPGAFSMYASASNPAFFEAIQMPGLGAIADTGAGGNIDYVGDNNPWIWHLQAGRPEIWGEASYEAVSL